MKRLKPSEIVELTGRRDKRRQAAELDRMGIPYGRRTDDSLVVLRAAVDAILMPADHQPDRGFELAP